MFGTRYTIQTPPKVLIIKSVSDSSQRQVSGNFLGKENGDVYELHFIFEWVRSDDFETAFPCDNRIINMTLHLAIETHVLNLLLC